MGVVRLYEGTWSEWWVQLGCQGTWSEAAELVVYVCVVLGTIDLRNLILKFEQMGEVAETFQLDFQGVALLVLMLTASFGWQQLSTLYLRFPDFMKTDSL